MDEHAPNPYQPPSPEAFPGPQQGGAAVVEDATRGARFLGADGLIGLVVALPLQFYLGYWEGWPNIEPPGLLESVGLAAFGFVVWMLVHGKFLAASGQTVGKKLIGTQMVDVKTNAPPGFAQLAFVRYLPISVATLIPMIGQFLVLIDVLFIFRGDRRCLHDHIAGTRVINLPARS